MDIIEIVGTQFLDILCWLGNNLELTEQFFPALMNGKIKFYKDKKHIDMVLAFNIEGEIHAGYNLQLTLGENPIVTYIYRVEPNSTSFVGKKIHDEKRYQVISHRFTARRIRNIFITVNAYLFHYKQDFDNIPIKTVVPCTIKKRATTKNTEKRTVIINNKWRLMGRVQKEKKIPKYKQWKTGSWSVRGHFRYYKNGNVVPIKPYTKGTGINKGTIYKV